MQSERSQVRTTTIFLGIVTGNPRVFQGYPYPYPPKTRTRTHGTGFFGFGLRVRRVRRVRKPVRRVECSATPTPSTSCTYDKLTYISILLKTLSKAMDAWPLFHS